MKSSIIVPNPSLVHDAWIYACEIHKHQKYGERPYSIHLKAVHENAKKFAINIPTSNLCLYEIAAILHDSIEDAGVTWNELRKRFGLEVAELVLCVTTTNQERTRKQKNAATYPKIKRNPAAQFIKLCDRIANVEDSKTNDLQHFEMYKKEQTSFQEGIRVEGYCDEMWSYLNKLFK